MKRILFFAEAVTLAHVARPYVLANAVKTEFDTHFAASSAFEKLFGVHGITRHRIASLSPGQFMQRLAAGQPVYNEKYGDIEGFDPHLGRMHFQIRRSDTSLLRSTSGTMTFVTR